jgi:hypothetical protein
VDGCGGGAHGTHGGKSRDILAGAGVGSHVGRTREDILSICSVHMRTVHKTVKVRWGGGVLEWPKVVNIKRI